MSEQDFDLWEMIRQLRAIGMQVHIINKPEDIEKLQREYDKDVEEDKNGDFR